MTDQPGRDKTEEAAARTEEPLAGDPAVEKPLPEESAPDEPLPEESAAAKPLPEESADAGDAAAEGGAGAKDDATIVATDDPVVEPEPQPEPEAEPKPEPEAETEAEAEPEPGPIERPARTGASPSTPNPTRDQRPRGYRGALSERDDRLARTWVIAVIAVFLLMLVLAFAGIPSRFTPEETPLPLPSVNAPSGSAAPSPS